MGVASEASSSRSRENHEIGQNQLERLFNFSLNAEHTLNVSGSKTDGLTKLHRNQTPKIFRQSSGSYNLVIKNVSFKKHSLFKKMNNGKNHEKL